MTAGKSLNDAIGFLIAGNERKNSPLCVMVDLGKVGIAGHSQDGVTAINMVTRQSHANMVKAVYATSTTSSYHAKNLGDEWNCDPGMIAVPTLFVARTGTWDTGTVTSSEQTNDEKNGIVQGICPLWSLHESYDAIPDGVDKVMSRRQDADHGDSYLRCGPYMTAWFAYCLQGDADAESAFFGDGSELARSKSYTDVLASQ